MREGWKETTLGDVFTLIRNGTNCEQSKSGHGEKISRIETISAGVVNPERIGFANLTDEQKAGFRLEAGDILFSHINSPIHVGKVAIVEQDHGIYHGINLLLFRTTPNILPQYAYYYLNSLFCAGYWTGICKQSVNQASVNQTDIKKVPISFPTSLPEQKRIVAILDEAFAGIAAATANAEKNLANARELFECVLQATFTKGGDGWLESALSEVCTLRSGTTVDKSLEKSAGDLPYLKVADMTLPENSGGIKTSSRFLNIAGMNKNNILPKGTVIFPKRGGAIMTNKKRLTEVPICADLNIMGVIPSDALLPEFLFMYFLTVDMRTLGSGSSIPQINNYDIEPMAISYPESLEEQRTIVHRLENVLSNTRRIENVYKKKVADLTYLKQAILQKAFSGELTALPEKTLQGETV